MLNFLDLRKTKTIPNKKFFVKLNGNSTKGCEVLLKGG